MDLGVRLGSTCCLGPGRSSGRFTSSAAGVASVAAAPSSGAKREPEDCRPAVDRPVLGASYDQGLCSARNSYLALPINELLPVPHAAVAHSAAAGRTRARDL